MKKLICIVVTSFLIVAALPVVTFAESPLPKNEIVYATLSSNGTTKNIYVVNEFNITENTDIVDYGDYIDVRNLTNTNSITQKNDMVSVQADKGLFSYQGNMKTKDLPWDISINYFLDGKAIEPANLAGKSGELKIEIASSKNNNVQSVFYDNYALQVSFTLDESVAKNISSEGATIVSSGKGKMVSFMALPESDMDYKILADVTNFEFDGIQIAGIPFASSVPELQTDGLTEDLNLLPSATNDLTVGAKEFSDGVAAYSDNGTVVLTGSTTIKSSLTAIANNIPAMQIGLNETGTGISRANELAATLLASDPTNATAQELSGLLSSLDSNYSVINTGVQSTFSGILGIEQNYSAFHVGLNDYVDGATEIMYGSNDLYLGINELNKEASTIPETMQAEIDKMLLEFTGKDFDPVSFVSDKNENINFVQFVLQCDSIHIEVAEEEKEVEEKETFWDRLLNLFK